MTELPKFRNFELLRQALTHRSYYNEHPDEGQDNERLEFLGDCILKFIIGKFLYQSFPQMREGKLSNLRSILENNTYQLAEFANQLNLRKLMRLGKGAELQGGRTNPELLSDTFEAIIGAYFLDSGIESVCQFVEPLLSSAVDEFICELRHNLEHKYSIHNKYNINYKGSFQEWALAKFGENPQYSIIDEAREAHERIFTAEVRVANKLYGIGKGRKKKVAEKAAARNALQKIEADLKFKHCNNTTWKVNYEQPTISGFRRSLPR